MATAGESVQGAPPGRKKFATPPVKAACLSCRSSRIRCDGGRPCISCANKRRECVYQPSRRGGARLRKKPRVTENHHGNVFSLASQFLPSTPPEELAVLPVLSEPLQIQGFIAPGAGLKNLGPTLNDSDALFDTLFAPEVNEAVLLVQPDSIEDIQEPMVRTYANGDALLNAYYIWIHPFFPILPPPHCALRPDDMIPLIQNRPSDIVEPSSPVALAISAILALVPCSQDLNPQSEASIVFRRNYAQFLAQTTFERVDSYNEKIESSYDPSQALGTDDDEYVSSREPFQPMVPQDLEGIIALDLLSIYEYAQRGNLKKMRSRTGLALMTAMNMSLHREDRVEDHFTEARRRTWWMTYVCATQSSIVSNTEPVFDTQISNFSTKFPSFGSDSQAWDIFIQSQQAILTATRFVIDLSEAFKTQADMSFVRARMGKLATEFGPLVDASDQWVREAPRPHIAHDREANVAQALRSMASIKVNSALIKVHRYCAFHDRPIFSGKHCDLKPSNEKGKDSGELRLWPSCCSSLGSSSPAPISTPNPSTLTAPAYPSPGSFNHVSTPSSLEGTTPQPHTHQPQPTVVFPYSSHQSARICLKSALNITSAFEAMPYPNPSTNALNEPSSHLHALVNFARSTPPPRTMPSFACCAMQSAYALLSVKEKTQAMKTSRWPPEGMDGEAEEGDDLVKTLLGRLDAALLSIYGTLENYGSAFEALGGMRDQVREKLFLSAAICEDQQVL